MKFWWWDDALVIADRRSAVTGLRHRVYGWQGFWYVEPVSR